MFERFTDRARRVVVLSQSCARARGHDYIDTGHLLLGLLEEFDTFGDGEHPGPVARYLELKKIDADELKSAIDQIIGIGDRADEEEPTPLTVRAKEVITLALRESLLAGHHYVGTEHLFCGLLREGEGVAAQLLKRRGLESFTMGQALLGVDVVRFYERESGLPSEQSRD